MSDTNNFNIFVNKIKESEFTMKTEMKKKILNRTYEKLLIASKKKIDVFSKRRYITDIFSIRNIAAACLVIMIFSAFIPNSPVNALYQKIFSFIPGVGVVQNNSEEDLIKGALDKSVRVVDNDEFMEVKSAYIANNALNVSIVTNIGMDSIGDIKDKKEVLKFFSGETKPGVYLLAESNKIKLENYSMGGPTSETKAYTIKGCFYLYENTPVNSLFLITMDGFEKTVDIRMSPVKNGVTPESMGKTITVNDIMIFADTKRSGSILSVDLSTVAPKIYQGIRFYLFNHENELFPESVYVLDRDGVKYYADEDLRKQNNSSVHTFYFRIPDDRQISKIVFPQILYSTDIDSEIKIRMPEIDKPVHMDSKIDLGDSSILLKKTSIISKNDSLLPENFNKFDCMKVDYDARYKEGSNIKILRIIPDILVPDSDFMTGYTKPSSAIFSDLLSFNKNTGYAIVHFNDMDRTKKIMINVGIEFAVIGPFEMDISDLS
jgi:hypothetical protein